MVSGSAMANDGNLWDMMVDFDRGILWSNNGCMRGFKKSLLMCARWGADHAWIDRGDKAQSSIMVRIGRGFDDG